ncbi:hypothetical protein SCLCIDRAFT_1213658 [Scleroderma citrinum Foug A]|uniref:Asteroid domain-containing protein n=1 Tax=Scleroderma citrinum Foug A TaxID=1036808 RepID=A0A0C3E773_9AGAM|nr:hypothetical protein SCLCIDRAFT_1213658 [Scleroderma citrinum Foug A]
MGVHGLTTYLHENQRVLSKTVLFPRPHVSDDIVTTVVVDGWSFIYEIYQQSQLPWVYGGEYAGFKRHVEQVVLSWIAVGLKVYFVFDGPSPELKIPTLISRLNRSNVEQSLIFFRTSQASRSTLRFLRETRILPPLTYECCVQTLQKLALSGKLPLEVHFADEEADPYAVELAGRLGAYVVSNDSDFVIFNSGHYAGYMSLDDMVWLAPVAQEETVISMNDDSNGGFQTVVRSKTKKQCTRQKQFTTGIIPPEDVLATDLTLTASVYSPVALASHLKIPVTILPLFASIVGNDFSNQSTTQRNIQSLFFEKRMSLSQRITRTANTLADILNAATQQRKAKHQVGSALDLIDRTVNALLIRVPNHMAPGEVEATVDRIVTAALQYAIDKYDGGVYGPTSLWPTRVCALHKETCPFAALFRRRLSHSPDETTGNGPCVATDRVTLMIGSMYVEAYRAGKLKPKIADIVSLGTFWPKLFLENPDIETVAKSIGRPGRRWIYAILADGVGLPEKPVLEAMPTASEDSSNVTQNSSEWDGHEEDPDELIDVVEENSSDDDADLLAPLRCELERLRTSDSASDIPASASSRSSFRSEPRSIIEYVRRGTRIAPEQVPVPDITALVSSSGLNLPTEDGMHTPFQLRSLEERMSLFFQILGSDFPQIRALPADQLVGVLAVRWVVQTLHLRAVESEMNKDRDNARWTYREARAFLAFYVAWSRHDGDGSVMVASSTPRHDAQMEGTAVPIEDRNVQLMAQILMAIETIQDLSQVLFLSDHVPVNVERLSGLRFHAHLTSPCAVADDTIPLCMWDACVHFLSHAFREERSKRNKKKKVDDAGVGTTREAKAIASYVTGGRSLFGMLVDAEA